MEDKLYWYFSISDCEEELGYRRRGGRELKYQIYLKTQEQQSELSIDQRGFILPYVVFWFVYFLLIKRNSQQYNTHKKKYDKIDWLMMGVLIVSCFQLLHISIALIDQLIYNYRGYPNIVVDYFAKVFDLLSQYALIILLILIAWGWTIKFIYIEDLNIYGPLFLFLTLGQLSFLRKLFDIQLLTFLVGDREGMDKERIFHHGTTHFGYLILFIQLLHYIGFLVSIIKTFRRSNNEAQIFMVQIGLIGSFFFLSHPLLHYICSMASTFNRSFLMTFGSLSSITLTVAILSYTLTSESGQYYFITVRKRFVLPGID